MPSPTEVFDNPNDFMNFVSTPRSQDFEGQCFDRKEIRAGNGSQVKDAKAELIQCVSAFANSNKEGGLIVLGVSDDGKIKGLKAIQEGTLSGILENVHMLRNQAVKSKQVSCKNDRNESDFIEFLYVPASNNGICETAGAFPKAWKRLGPHCQPLTETDREALKRDKKLVDFEMARCSTFDQGLLDKDVIQEYRKSIIEHRGAQYEHGDQELLLQAGALIRESVGFGLTNAGALFFLSNPRAVLPGAFVRLLKFEANLSDKDTAGLPTFDRDFDGPLPSLVRRLRTYLKDAAFFKEYSMRKPDGGFVQEPEYPLNAVDEAIVNAVIHRDYGISNPVKCIAYRDAFVVMSPGGVPQAVPTEFSLDKVSLSSLPRNPKIVEWMRTIRDEKGLPFVRALSEGTKTMNREMGQLGLPSPHYKTKNNTVVMLSNKIEEREKIFLSSFTLVTEGYTNLFRIIPERPAFNSENSFDYKRKIIRAIRTTIENKGWYIDSFGFSRLICHAKRNTLQLSQSAEEVAKMYPAYEFQVRQYGSDLFLTIDYKVELKSVLSANALAGINSISLVGKRVVARQGDQWLNGRITEFRTDTSTIVTFGSEKPVVIPNSAVIPYLSKTEITKMFHLKRIALDLDQKLKEYSLASKPSAARERAEKSISIARFLEEQVFPLNIDGLKVTISSKPTSLKLSSPGKAAGEVEPLTVFQDMGEPQVEFYKHMDAANILDGLTKFGSYEKDPLDISLIPLCPSEKKKEMELLIDRLSRGKFKYQGSERTFGVKFTYQSVVVARVEAFIQECERLVTLYSDWPDERRLRHLFLIYLPEAEYPASDISSPYYSLKEILLRHGFPVQMVDAPTLANPDFKDVNLALNIIAKCGRTPWVLPDELPDVDFFIGLSYTANVLKGKTAKLMGFANVFNKYGRWQFYHGNARTFDYDERQSHYRQLIKQTMERMDLGDTPSIHFHYSAKFSREDRDAILEAARGVRPRGRFTFVWINTGHNIRLYDASAQSDGSLARGSYVVTSPYQFLLSTTGYNLFRRSLGTPKPLEVNVRVQDKNAEQTPDLRVVAKHIMYLTKLNWASSHSICSEPITTKYAGDIARLTAILLETAGLFNLHPALERTPWFI